MPMNECVLNQAAVGAAKFAEKGMTGERWRKEMEAEFGDFARRNWKEIYAESYRQLHEQATSARQAARERAATRFAGERQPRDGGPLFDDAHEISPERIRAMVDAHDRHKAEARKARVDLAKAYHAIQKSTGWEIATALRKAGLLTGVKTHLRNLGGNVVFQVGEEIARVPASIVDAAVGVVTGQRTITGPDARAIARAGYEAATKGVREAKEILKNGATIEDLERLQLHKELQTNSRVLDAYVNGVFRALAAEDRVFRTYALRRALEDRAMAIAKTEARTKKGLNVRERAAEIVREPPEHVMADAILDAEVATFNNQNVAAEAYSRAKSFLQNVEVGGRKVGRPVAAGLDVVLPFVRTPANIFARMIDYSPLGFAKTAAHGARLTSTATKGWSAQAQRDFSQSVGRASAGTALMILGAKLGEAGILTGTRDDDESKASRDAAANRSPMSIKIGGAWHSIGGFAPFGMLLALGATLQREHDQERKDASATAGKMAGAALNLATEQPMLRGARDVLDAIERPGSKGQKFVDSLAASVIPTAVSDVGTAFDTKRRDARGVVEAVQSRIPGLRNALPEAFDALGRDKESSPLDAINPFLSKTAREDMDPIDAELVRLDVGITKAQKKPGEKDDAARERQRAVGRDAEKMLARIVGSDAYRALGDDQKRVMVENAIRASKQGAPPLDSEESRRVFDHNTAVDARRLGAVERLRADARYQALGVDAREKIESKLKNRLDDFEFRYSQGESETAAAKRFASTAKAFEASTEAKLDAFLDDLFNPKKAKSGSEAKAPRPLGAKAGAKGGLFGGGRRTLSISSNYQ